MAMEFQVSLCSSAGGALPKDLHNWWMEPKMDGIRVELVAKGDTIELWSRQGGAWHGRLPAVEQCLKGLDLVLDGEVVWFDPKTGEVDFHRGSGIFRQQNSALAQQHEGPLTYVVFDILRIGEHDLRRLPIEQRRQLLEELVGTLDCPQLRLIEHCEASPEAQADFIAKYREGVVLKKKGSRYVAGRPPTWQKLKVIEDADVVIMGAVEGGGKYAGTLGAVAFGQYKDGELVYRGQCSGMTDATRFELWNNLDKYIGRVLVIRHMGADGGSGFRHPQWSHLRSEAEGKSPEECVWS